MMQSMMRRGVAWVLGMSAVMGLGVVCLEAWEGDRRAFILLAKKAKAEQARPSTPTVDPKSYWEGTAWAIEWMPMSGPKGKGAIKDTLHFEKGKVTSAHLSGKGFPSTNFSARIGDDGTPIWETMQTSENQDVANWRGELHGETLRGIVSQKPVKGASEDYAFAGQRIANPPKMEAPVAAAPTAKNAATK